MGGTFILIRSQRPDLPRIPLPDGGEFRVVQVTYTPKASESHEHNIGAAPKYQFTLWKMLPRAIQARVSYPHDGIGYTSSNRPALSIWWAYFVPKTGKPELGPTDYVVTTLDNGEELEYRDWPNPTDEGYRQIFITDPPTHSKRLRFRLSAEDQPVEFSIENPAYRE